MKLLKHLTFLKDVDLVSILTSIKKSLGTRIAARIELGSRKQLCFLPLPFKGFNHTATANIWLQYKWKFKRQTASDQVGIELKLSCIFKSKPPMKLFH